MVPKTQLIAHDKEVYDIAFACGKDIFGTVGADGSLRMFDLRYVLMLFVNLFFVSLGWTWLFFAFSVSE